MIAADDTAPAAAGALPDGLSVMPRAHAEARDPEALAKLVRGLGPGPFVAVILFISPQDDRAVLASGV